MSRQARSRVAIGLAAWASLSLAQTGSGQTNITNITTGWATEGFGLQTTSPIVNPAHCAVVDSYQVDNSVPGYKTYYAAALLAFGMGRSVQITVSNTACTQSRPSIIGIVVNAS